MSLHTPNPDSTLAAVLKSLDDDKAEDVVQIDLRGKSEMGDFMVIASGRSSRQVASMAEKLTDRLKQTFGILSKVEGRGTGDWVLIDTGDVIVHVFRPEVREFYQLEKMWLNPGDTTGDTSEVAVKAPLMRVTLCVVGRLRAGPERDLIDDYLQRFDRTGRALGLGPLAMREVEDRKGGGMSAEATLLERALPPNATVIALDERGKIKPSPDFAADLARYRDDGRSDLVFIIGGADGIDPALRAKCDAALSFGKMVWPHMLVRVMLAEQLYRAASILAGSPYHRA